MKNKLSISVVPSMPWADSFVEETFKSTNPDVSILDGMTVVVVENKEHGAKLQQCYGIPMALRILRKNPNQRITLSGVLPIEYVRKAKPEVDVLLRRETIRFIELPYTVEELINVWKNPSVHVADPSAMNKHSRNTLSVILHGLKVANPKQPASEYEKRMVRQTVDQAKEFFPSLVAMSDNNVLDFLFEASAAREEVRKGEFLEGVFCDIDGTLLVDGNINQKTLSVLKKYETEGKVITLWTDGDIDATRKILVSNNVQYPLHRKSEFAGAEVEIAVDDLDEFAFNARTKITARKFIRVDW